MAELKTVTVNIKADGDGLTGGQFTGYASVFGNKDSYGDVVAHGAFAKTIDDNAGAGFPVYWQHRMDDPDMNIGKTVEIREDDRGLFVKVQLDTTSAKGAQVHKLIKEGRVSQMSFAYDTIKQAEVDGGPWNGGHMELQELKLHEVSVVPIGANQETELLAVKTNPKDVRAIPAKSLEAIKAAHDALAALVPLLKESDDSNVSDEELQEAKAEDRESDKAKEPNEVKARKDPNAALAYLNAVIQTAQP